MTQSTRRVRPHFRLTVIPTGRLAAYDPNVLAIPKHSTWGKRIRKAIIAPRHFVFGSWDYNQLEMRIMAHVSQDRGLLKAYREGIDIHAQTAFNIFGVDPKDQDESLHRLPAKTTGFGILMGISGYGLAEQLNAYSRQAQIDAAERGETIDMKLWEPDKCSRFINIWLNTYPSVRQFQQARRREVEEYGIVRDFNGRRFLLPQVWCAQQKLADHALRQAQAMPIQSGAQVVVKRAMAQIPFLLTKFPGAVYPLLQVHDELDFEVRKTRLKSWHAALKSVMETTTALSVPIIAEGKAGPSWGELKRIA